MPNIPTEPIGSVPRPQSLLQAMAANPEDPALEALYDAAVWDTIEQFEATGSPVIRARVEGTALASARIRAS